MRRIGKLIAVFVGLLAIGAVAWRLAAGTVSDRIRRVLEATLRQGIDAAVSIEGLRITLLPPAVHVEQLTIGHDGIVACLGRTDVRIDALESARQLRPAATVDITGLALDLPRLLAAIRTTEPTGLPTASLVARHVRITDASVIVIDNAMPLVASFPRLDGVVEVGGAVPEIRFRARTLQATLQRSGEELRFNRIRVDGRVGAAGVLLSRVQLRGDGVRLVGGMRGEQSMRHAVRGEVALDQLRLFTDTLAPLGGRAAVDATVNGSMLHPEIAGQVLATGVRFGERVLGDWHGGVSLRDWRLTVEDLQGRLYGGESWLNGTMALRRPFDFDLTARWDRIDPTELALLARPDEPPLLAAAGQLAATGTLRPIELHATGTGTFARAGTAAPPLAWTARGDYQGAASRLSLSMEQTRANQLRGDVVVGETGALQGSLQIDVADTQALSRMLSANAPVPTGALHAAVQLDGTIASPSFTAGVRGTNVAAFGVTATQLDGRIAGDRQQIRVEGLTAHLDGGTAHLEGTFALAATASNAWTIWLRDVPGAVAYVAALPFTNAAALLSGGRLSGRAEGRGSWSAVQVRAHAELEEFEIGGESFERLVVDGDTTWPLWTASVRLVRADEETLSAGMRGTGTSTLTLGLESTDWRLEGLRWSEKHGVAGRVRVQANVEGPPARLTGRVEVDARNVAWGPRRAESITLRAEAAAGSWRLRGDVDGRITLSGQLGSQRDALVSLLIEWDDAELAPLLSDDAQLKVHSSGTVTLTVPLRDPRRISGDAVIAALHVSRAEYTVSAAEPVRIRAEGGRFTIGSLLLAGTGMDLSGSGGFDIDGEVGVRLRGHADLRLLESLTATVESASGDVALDATIDHAAGGGWDLGGRATLTAVTIDAGLQVALTDLNGSVTLDGGIIRVDELSGRAGGGTLTIGGSVDVGRGPSLTWSVSEALVAPLPDLNTELTGDGTVDGRWDDMTIAGSVRVVRAVYERRIALTDFIPWFRRTVARPPSGKPPARIVRLDVRVVAPGDVFIDNNVAEVELRLDLRIGGTTTAFTIAGPVEVLEGKVMFRDRTYEVTRGTIDFRPELGLNPYLNINAETIIETREASYTITVQVVGTLNDYRVLLSADDSSLTQTDIASLVAFGKTTAQMQQEGSGVSVNDLIALTPNLLTGQMEAGVSWLLPVDRVDIEPGYSKTSGLYEPRVSIGKDLTDNLSALVSTTLGVEARRAVQLEYRLTPRISLLGSWESATTEQSGAFGGDVKVRYYFRRLRRFSLLAPWRGWYGGELQ